MRFNNETVRLKRDTDVAQMRANRASDTSGIAFVIMAESGTIDEVTATEHMEIFAAWEPSVSYSVGNLRIYKGVLYKCVQAHTSQEGWEPDKTAALWKVAGDPAEEFPEWSQPIGAQDAYMAGDKVTYDGRHWVSTVDNNVWAPGVFGWDAIEPN